MAINGIVVAAICWIVVTIDVMTLRGIDSIKNNPRDRHGASGCGIYGWGCGRHGAVEGNCYILRP